MHTKALPCRNGSAARFDKPYLTARMARRAAGALTLCLLSGLVLGSQCMAPPGTDEPDPDDGNSAPLRHEVTIFTNMGNLTLELFPQQAPEAVAKFLDLVEEDAYYDGKIFHYSTATSLIAGAYDVSLEDGESVPFVNESNNGLKNIRGRVALYGPTNETSGKPQFLINLAANPSLDFTLSSGQKVPYTVIGRVIRGMDIADDIAQLETIAGTSSQGDSLQRVPQTDTGHKVRIIRITSDSDTELVNTAPVASAGEDQTVEPQAKVTLDGSDSSDPDGDPINYEWKLTDASRAALTAAKIEISLDNAAAVNPKFTAPRPTAPLDIVFELSVTDDRGAGNTDTVTITLSDNTKPVANAGADKTGHPGDTVQLDGSASSDADPETTLSYAWAITPESEALLTARGLTVPAPGTTAKYSFTAPTVTAPLPLTFQLTVTDGKGGQATDTAEVKILPVSFNTAVSYAVDGQPTAIAAGDFNGDSFPDIAVTKSTTNEVAVMMNDGTGVLLSPVLYPVGETPSSLVVADFNNDGSPDIAAATRDDNQLSVLINLGNGVFAEATSFPMGSSPLSLASADFDGTSGLDLAAVNTGTGMSNSLAVLINDGQAAFPSGNSNVSLTGKDDNNATITPVGGRVLAAGKIDTDNQADLVVAYADRKVFVLLGDNTKAQNFRFASYFEAGPSGVTDPRGIALADVSGDSKLDVVVAMHAINKIAVRKNSGSGRFGFEALFDTGFGPSAVTGADLDGDKDIDLAVTNETANSVSILQNKGTGSFKSKVDLPLADGDSVPVGLVAADLNGDKAVDLAVVNRVSGTVSIFLNLTVSADAGEDQDTVVNEPVTLHGQGKSRENATFTYAWSQVSGPTVTLSDPTAAEPTFTAPAEPRQLTFRLTATDDQGATATDTVNIDVYAETASGLKYCDVVKGTGALVLPSSTISVLYTGRLDNRSGETFDSTSPANEPREFALGGLIEGWKEGLANYDMRAGGKRLLIIPPELGYGAAPQGSIPANSTLWFELEVLEVK